ncbi:ATP-dependent RNA helicase DBP10 [Dissostichus eleginoides]|uniref:ATP-dependent RNA helicase DBP10 n=1 Tax=Dissostichus eleginoides TaxID=100907 RepID=A0AAD9BY92_DISEL|nr:ATP-dependent RNA helicase DBP10 [Dissostichus eleginoides]
MNNTHTHTPSAVQIPSVSLIVATPGSGLVSASRAEGLSGQLAWLILLLEATGSQNKGQGPPGGHRAGISGSREWPGLEEGRVLSSRPFTNHTVSPPRGSRLAVQ